MNDTTATTTGCCCGCAPVPLPEPPAAQQAPVRKTARAVPSILLSVLIAFFPKCPVCWAVYMSMFSSVGLARLPYMGWLLPVLFALLGLHLYLLWRKAPRNGYLPFAGSVAGALIILTAKVFFPSATWLLFTGMGCIIGCSLLNSFLEVRPRLRHSHTSSISPQ